MYATYIHVKKLLKRNCSPKPRPHIISQRSIKDTARPSGNKAAFQSHCEALTRRRLHGMPNVAFLTTAVSCGRWINRSRWRFGVRQSFHPEFLGRLFFLWRGGGDKFLLRCSWNQHQSNGNLCEILVLLAEVGKRDHSWLC